MRVCIRCLCVRVCVFLVFKLSSMPTGSRCCSCTVWSRYVSVCVCVRVRVRVCVFESACFCFRGMDPLDGTTRS